MKKVNLECVKSCAEVLNQFSTLNLAVRSVNDKYGISAVDSYGNEIREITRLMTLKELDTAIVYMIWGARAARGTL